MVKQDHITYYGYIDSILSKTLANIYDRENSLVIIYEKTNNDIEFVGGIMPTMSITNYSVLQENLIDSLFETLELSIKFDSYYFNNALIEYYINESNLEDYEKKISEHIGDKTQFDIIEFKKINNINISCINMTYINDKHEVLKIKAELTEDNLNCEQFLEITPIKAYPLNSFLPDGEKNPTIKYNYISVNQYQYGFDTEKRTVTKIIP